MLLRLFLTKARRECAEPKRLLPLLLSMLMKLCFFALSLLFGSVMAELLCEGAFAGRAVETLLVVGMLVDFGMKLFSLSTDKSYLLRYLCLPIEKRSLLPFYVADELLAAHNYYWVSFMLPVAMCDAAACAGGDALLFALLGSFFNTLLLRWMGLLVDYRSYFWILPVLAVGSLVACDSMWGYALGGVVAWCDALLMLLNSVGFVFLFRWETRRAFEGAPSAGGAAMEFTNGSALLNFLSAELFHTSLKKRIVLMVLLSANLFLVSAVGGLTWLLLLLPMFWVGLLADTTFSAEASCFDGLQVLGEGVLRRLFEQKLRVCELVCLMLALVLSPALIGLMGMDLLAAVAYGVFLLGSVVPAAFSCVVANERRMDVFAQGLGGSGWKSGGFSVTTAMAMGVIGFMYCCFALLPSVACSWVWLVTGGIGFALRKKVKDVVWRVFLTRRYSIADAFRRE